MLSPILAERSGRIKVTAEGGGGGGTPEIVTKPPFKSVFNGSAGAPNTGFGVVIFILNGVLEKATAED